MIYKTLFRLISTFRIVLRFHSFRRKKIYISLDALIKLSNFESHIYIGKKVNVIGSKIGMGTYIGQNSVLPYARIGRFCSISKNVEILQNNHPVSEYVSTHPSFHRGSSILMKKIGLSFNLDNIYPYTREVEDNIQVVIGSDVWIGDGVKIMPGITIGDGSIIAAGAIVTKSVEPFTIVGGVPAKKIKYRFELSVISNLLNIKWWNWPLEKIINNQADFCDIKKFVDKHVVPGKSHEHPRF